MHFAERHVGHLRSSTQVDGDEVVAHLIRVVAGGIRVTPPQLPPLVGSWKGNQRGDILLRQEEQATSYIDTRSAARAN